MLEIEMKFPAAEFGAVEQKLAAWRARSVPWWGRAVEARCGDVVLRGVVRGLDGRGALILDLADGSQRAVLSGEVRELRLES